MARHVWEWQRDEKNVWQYVCLVCGCKSRQA